MSLSSHILLNQNLDFVDFDYMHFRENYYRRGRKPISSNPVACAVLDFV